MYSRLARTSLGALAALLCVCTAAGTAFADAKSTPKCSAAIIKAGGAFVQAEAKALQKCRDTTLKGKKACDQVKTDESIAKARLKLSDTIVKACRGKDKSCDTVDADGSQPTLTEIGWNIGTCPNFEGGTCTNTITDCDDIPTCLQCIGEASVNQAIDLYFPNGRPASTGDKVLNKCQSTIGKAAVTFLAAKSKALSKCWGTKVKKTANCPADAQAAISTARAKFIKAIAKPCLGLNNSTIGLASNCLDVTSEGTATCNAPVDTLIDVGNCVACVTEFKAECPDRAAAVSVGALYPAGCLVAPPTPTITPTPTPTPTESGTQTPTPAATCGDGIVNTGEFCDTPGTGGACGPGFACDANCNCACPSKVHFTGDATAPESLLDSGWTGIAHRSPIISNGDVTVNVSCAASVRPCGVCNVTGLAPNAGADAGQLNNRRCSNDSSIKCADDAPCIAGGGTCKFYFGAPLPLAAGGVSSCVFNTFASDVSGTANVETGDAATVAHLNSRVFLGFDVDNPCARCQGDATINDGVAGGTCDNGTRTGLACDGNGQAPGRPDFGVTSLDCPTPGTGVATLPIDLTNSTGTVTKTLTASSPKCTGVGFTTENCLCDTCNTAAQEPCSTASDCPASGGGPGICGGTRCLGGPTPGAPCLTCIGGSNHGAICANGSACPGGTCPAVCGVCSGGAFPGNNCALGADCNTKKCAGGANAGASCTVNSQCPGGSCTNVKTCVSGTNAGALCTVASECPGGTCPALGSCSGSCNRPGTATKPSDCQSDADPVFDCAEDGASGEGSCTLGPVDNTCTLASGHPQRGCLGDGDCGGALGSCVTASRRCFLTGGFSGDVGTDTLVAEGASDVPMGDVSNPTLGAVFCIGPTSASAINAAAGLPGPGRVTIKGTAEGLP